MPLRKLEIEFKKFPKRPNGNFKEVGSNQYIKSFEVDLFKLNAQYKIEEFDDDEYSQCYTEFAALRYLLPSTNLFKFRSGQPGSSKDSRKEHSRVLGQTFCRYINHYFLDAIFTVHISTFLGKQLGHQFSDVQILRKSDGDTPDFISAKSDRTIFLSEAKGRRKIVPFTDGDFGKWRKQFDRVSILEMGIEKGLKGYILELVIANEKNKLKNSKILIEDPWTTGERIQENISLFNLIKCGHYKEALDKIGLGYVGEALIFRDKLVNSQLEFPVFIHKSFNKEYVGIFDALNSRRLGNGMIFSRSESFRNSTRYFYGIEKGIFKNLMSIARGEFALLNEIAQNKEEIYFNESAIGYMDGSIMSVSGLLEIKDFEKF